MKQPVAEVLRGFGGLFQATMKEGALSVREKELIALGIGLAVRCVPCINLHVEKYLHTGAMPLVGPLLQRFDGLDAAACPRGTALASGFSGGIAHGLFAPATGIPLVAGPSGYCKVH